MNYFNIDMLGWIGFLFILFGYYLNARKRLHCFSIWGIGNIVYFIYGYIIHAFPVMAMSIFVLGMNIYGYIIWNKKK